MDEYPVLPPQNATADALQRAIGNSNRVTPAIGALATFIALALLPIAAHYLPTPAFFQYIGTFFQQVIDCTDGPFNPGSSSAIQLSNVLQQSTPPQWFGPLIMSISAAYLLYEMVLSLLQTLGHHVVIINRNYATYRLLHNLSLLTLCPTLCFGVFQRFFELYLLNACPPELAAASEAVGLFLLLIPFTMPLGMFFARTLLHRPHLGLLYASIGRWFLMMALSPLLSIPACIIATAGLAVGGIIIALIIGIPVFLFCAIISERQLSHLD